MLRGEIRLVDFDPVLPDEEARTRPAVIVSNDGANTRAARLGRGIVTVLPLTSSVDRVYPFQVLLPTDDTGLPVSSKVQAEQVRSVSVSQIGAQIGSVPAPLMLDVDEAIRLHLAL